MMKFKMTPAHVSMLSLGVTAIGAVVAIMYYRNAAAAAAGGSAASPLFQSAALPSYPTGGGGGGSGGGGGGASDTASTIDDLVAKQLVAQQQTAQTAIDTGAINSFTAINPDLVSSLADSLPGVPVGGSNSLGISVNSTGTGYNFSATSTAPSTPYYMPTVADTPQVNPGIVTPPIIATVPQTVTPDPFKPDPAQWANTVPIVTDPLAGQSYDVTELLRPFFLTQQGEPSNTPLYIPGSAAATVTSPDNWGKPVDMMSAYTPPAVAADPMPVLTADNWSIPQQVPSAANNWGK